MGADSIPGRAPQCTSWWSMRCSNCQVLLCHEFAHINNKVMPDTQPVCRDMCPQCISSQDAYTCRRSRADIVELCTYTGHEGNIDAIAKVIEASPEFARQLDYSARPGTKTYPRCGNVSRSSLTIQPAYPSFPCPIPGHSHWSASAGGRTHCWGASRRGGTAIC
jgi:hypothetical protein